MNAPSESLRVRAGRAALVSGSSELVNRGLMVVLSFATARALAPTEVGILGLAVIVVGVLSMLTAFGETAAIIGRAESDDHAYALAALVFRSAATVVLVSLTFVSREQLAAWLTSDVAEARALETVLAILFLHLAGEAVGTYPRVRLQRSLDLPFVSAVTAGGIVIHVGLSVALLCVGYGIAVLAWALVASTWITCSIFWWRTGLGTGDETLAWPSVVCWRDLRRQTAKLFAGGFLGYLNCRLDNLLVSAMLGPAAMSFYGMAWNAARLPASIVGRSASFVLVPTVAQLHGERATVERGLRECLLYSYVLLAPLCVGLYLAAPDAVRIVLGAKWLPVVPILRIMCVTVLVTPLIEISNSLLIALGRGHLSAIATMTQLATILVLVPVMSRAWGVIGAAYADVAAAGIDAIALCVTARLALPEIRWLSLADAAAPIVAALVAALAAAGLTASMPAGAATTLALLVAFTALYSLAIGVLGGRERFRESRVLLRRIVPSAWSAAPSR
jgi:O-antigen/teichoic acid export membrane protein